MRGLLSQNGSATQEERAKVALLGEKERALDLLEKWIVSANKATLGWLHNDTDFDSLREHPRFRALVEGNPEGGTAV